MKRDIVIVTYFCEYGKGKFHNLAEALLNLKRCLHKGGIPVSDRSLTFL